MPDSDADGDRKQQPHGDEGAKNRWNKKENGNRKHNRESREQDQGPVESGGGV
jgi:hypothetical protein